MSRPKPKVLLESINPRSFKTEQILRSKGIYAVFYEGKPINIKLFNKAVDYPSPRYKKSSFPNPAHAFNMAERLNKMFKTDKFEVYLLSSGIKVTEKGE